MMAMQNITNYRDYSLLSFGELAYLRGLCPDIPEAGDIVIAGTYLGGDTALFLHGTINKVIVIDSFAGIGKPMAGDDGNDLKEGECHASLEQFHNTLTVLNSPMYRLSVYQQFIDDSNIRNVMTNCVSLLWLDLDLYMPTKICLQHFLPKLHEKGICIVHDYDFVRTPGVKKACDELSLTFKRAYGGIWRKE